jgi:hypothetical protein
LVVALFCSNVIWSQETNQQIEIKVENDKLFLLDRYYTNGLFISYKRHLRHSFLFEKNAENELQLKFTIGNQTYTPKNHSSFNTNDFDRPFAGWFFGALEIGEIKQNAALFLRFETGITGEESLSGKLQTFFHELLKIDNLTWVEEIAYKVLFNINFRYYHGWGLSKKSALLYKLHPSFGTKDVFLENSVYYYFGRFNGLRNSSRLGIIDKTKTNEFYGSVRLGYKYVAHNTLIQGSIFKDDILFTANPTRHIFKLKVEGVYKFNSTTFKLSANFNSKETPTSIFHAYGSIIYSRAF